MIGCKFYYQDSTNNSLKWAKDHINEAPDGSVFIAKKLTGARGRQGRVWRVYPGQVLLTILLKPSSKKDLHFLGMALSLGVLYPLKKYGVKLKWPNDFMLSGKKLGGMLLEPVWEGSDLKGIVWGLALNVNNQIDGDLKSIATSIRMECNLELDLETLQLEVLRGSDNFYREWKSKNYQQIFEEWKNNQGYLDQVLRVHKVDKSYASGLVEGFFDNGDLLLRQESGDIMSISYHDVLELQS